MKAATAAAASERTAPQQAPSPAPRQASRPAQQQAPQPAPHQQQAPHQAPRPAAVARAAAKSSGGEGAQSVAGSGKAAAGCGKVASGSGMAAAGNGKAEAGNGKAAAAGAASGEGAASGDKAAAKGGRAARPGSLSSKAGAVHHADLSAAAALAQQHHKKLLPKKGAPGLKLASSLFLLDGRRLHKVHDFKFPERRFPLKVFDQLPVVDARNGIKPAFQQLDEKLDASRREQQKQAVAQRIEQIEYIIGASDAMLSAEIRLSLGAPERVDRTALQHKMERQFNSQFAVLSPGSGSDRFR